MDPAEFKEIYIQNYCTTALLSATGQVMVSLMIAWGARYSSNPLLLNSSTSSSAYGSVDLEASYRSARKALIDRGLKMFDECMKTPPELRVISYLWLNNYLPYS